MKVINFTKMVATGNDFVVLDNRLPSAGYRLPQLAVRLCERKLGIGADGLLVLEGSRKADFRMRIFNPDGSEPEMCGNGSRCVALYAKNRDIAPDSMSIETGAGLLRAKVSAKRVKINMTEPRAMRPAISLRLAGKAYRLHYMNTGVPHVVCFVNDLNKVNLDAFGRGIRYHDAFSPMGANVNIVSLEKGPYISIRTYERGVEAETLACGTGAVACAIASSMVKGLTSPVKVFTKGGRLDIYFKRKDSKFHDVFLEGAVNEVFTGAVNI
jgi:diaminopimelate epimerase